MTYRLGKKYVDDGIWFEYPGGGRFKVCRAERNVAFIRVKRDLERSAKGSPNAVLPDGEFDPQVAHDIAAEAYARTILLDWEGVVDEQGNAVAYTPALGKQLLDDDEQFAKWLVRISVDESQFRLQERDDTVKKSSRPSAGTKRSARK
jgi:hypothetical protein